MKRNRIVAVVLGLLVWSGSVVYGASMGVKFNGVSDYTVTGTAGAPGYEQANWTNADGDTDSWGQTWNLVDDQGASTGAVMDFYACSFMQSFTMVNTASQNEHLMNSSLGTWTGTSDGLGSDPCAFRVINIPYAKYDVVVYFTGIYEYDTVAKYSIGSTNIFARIPAMASFNTMGFVQVPSTSTEDLQGNTPAGNFIVFKNVTGTTLQVSGVPGWFGNSIYSGAAGQPRALISGFQIVEVPQDYVPMIGINIKGAGVEVAGTAGAPGYVQNHWNNSVGDRSSYGAKINPLIDNAGRNTAASLDYFHGGFGSTFGSNATESAKLMGGFLATWLTDINSTDDYVGEFKILNVPYQNYDVVIYSDMGNSFDYVTHVKIGNQERYLRDPAGVQYDVTNIFTLVPESSTTNQGLNTPAGNYTVFKNVTGSTLTVRFCGTALDNGDPEHPFGFVSAIQIVEAPILLGLTISPDDIMLNVPAQISITCETSDAVIRYTTDGSDPTESSTLYSGPITINRDGTNDKTLFTLKARAWKDGLGAGPIKTVAYNFTQGKKLIEYGWDVPSPSYVKEHIAEMETRPFDGVVIYVPSALDSNTILGWKVFNGPAITASEYEPAIADLQATAFKKFSDNFIQIQTYSHTDWFDDANWDVIAANAGAMAKIAKEGKCVGLMIDPETYLESYTLFNYGTLPAELQAAHTKDQYKAKVMERGQQFMQAINAEFPNIQILFLFGPGANVINSSNFDLLVPFIDGMCQVADAGTKITDGFENSYTYTTLSQFEQGKSLMEVDSRNLFTDTTGFDRVMQCGFGLMLDWGYWKAPYNGWHPNDPTLNYFDLAEWETVIRSSLAQSDRYVWVYSEEATWWGATDVGAYEQAQIDGRTKAAQIPGDANGDGMVDVGDLGILAANYGGSGKTWAQGDFNNDGLVDVGDLGILAANYGKGTTSSSTADFNADYSKVFSSTVADEEKAATENGSSVCGALGLPIIVGLALMGLMLVKLEE